MQLNAKTFNCRGYRIPGTLPRVRSSIWLWVGLLAFHGFGLCAFAQDQPKPWSRTVSLDVTQPLTKPAEYRSADKTPETKTELEFKSDGRHWSLLTFDRLPQNITLKVDGKFEAYEPFEEIQTGKYYPFKTRLPITLEIEPGAHMPVQIEYQLGAWSPPSLQTRFDDRTSQIGEVRKFADEAQNVRLSGAPQTLIFSWDAQVTPGSPSSASGSTGLTPDPTPDASWETYLDENLWFVIGGVLVLILLVFLLFKYGLSLIANTIEKLQSPRENTLGSTQDGTFPPDFLKQSTIDEPKYKSNVYVHDGRSIPNQGAGQDQHRQLPKAQIYNPPEKTPARPPYKIGAPPITPEGNHLDLITEEVKDLKHTLAQKADRQEQERSVAKAAANLEDKLRAAEERLNAQHKALETILLTQGSELQETCNSLTAEVGEYKARELQAKKQFEDLLAQVLIEVKTADERVQSRVVELQTALDRQTVPESFFNKTLGLVLGQNVETLQDGNFERLIGEKLNQFFQTGVEHGEGLHELRLRAEGINAALKDVLLQMEKLHPQASVEARQPMQRVEVFVNELSGVQSQMQTRRATIETTLRIPVSMHAGARQTFLDELGRGIRREIDKLNDPQSYFESEIERLITADLMAIVDICDKTVAPPPGSRLELEATLKRLFDRAGLRSILPRQGDAFKTAEQDLVEMAQGSGKSLTVAQVMTRGFYYKHRDDETLLRKAAVAVYR